VYNVGVYRTTGIIHPCQLFSACPDDMPLAPKAAFQRQLAIFKAVRQTGSVQAVLCDAR
jgi:hypothetical protein